MNVFLTPSALLETTDFVPVVQFHEINKKIIIPAESSVIVNKNYYRILQNIEIVIDKTIYPFTARTILIFNSLNSTFRLLQLAHYTQIPIIDTEVVLGSFMLKWINNELKFESISGNFNYRHIKTETNNETKGVGLWSGKKANFVGDSITSNGMYINTVKEILNLSVVRNYGVGGSSLCYRNNQFDVDYPPLISRWKSIDKDADVLFILIGTNDYTSNVPLGNSDSRNESEFNGALNIIMEGLRKDFPDKLIIFSTILRRVEYNRFIHSVEDYNNAIKEKCKHYGIICFDSWEETGLNFAADIEKVTTDDGLHPNEKGAKILGQRIATFINGK